MGEQRVYNRTWGQWVGTLIGAFVITAGVGSVLAVIVWGGANGLDRLGIGGGNVSVPDVRFLAVSVLALAAGIACIAGAGLRPRVVSNPGGARAGGTARHGGNGFWAPDAGSGGSPVGDVQREAS